MVGALAAIDCEVEDILERHSHAIVIGRVRDLKLSGGSSALAYWHGRYVEVNHDEDLALLAEVGIPDPAPEAEGLARSPTVWHCGDRRFKQSGS